ncbi:MNIO family bufferin maturase [Rhizobium sp. F40D2]|uniref:MNIO family bufferin maturase n=1 Tax=Rhizobium sp. F40D2 TaxID=3453141 RepID=UPI003F1E9636
MSKIFPSNPVPNAAGIGLRSQHIGEMLSRRPSAGWLEVHAENCMGGSAAVDALERLRESYPLSIHGVGLSLGSSSGLDRDHLERMRKLCLRFQPSLVSEHLAWSAADGAYLNDLLPLRYDAQALAVVSTNILRLQDALQRRVFIENLSAYIAFEDSTMTEAEFLAELVRLTDCGLLLDVNNVYVSACNLGFDAKAFIDLLPAHAVGEIHLAGHAVNEVEGDIVLIDDHGSRVPPAVWSLYAYAIRKIGHRPTLIEWDTDVPALDVLLGEAMWADMLAQSIAFEDRMLAARPAPQTSRFDGMVLPLQPASTKGPMPALAALATIKPSVFAIHSGARRSGHAF